jgi:hypothetical protein
MHQLREKILQLLSLAYMKQMIKYKCNVHQTPKNKGLSAYSPAFSFLLKYSGVTNLARSSGTDSIRCLEFGYRRKAGLILSATEFSYHFHRVIVRVMCIIGFSTRVCQKKKCDIEPFFSFFQKVLRTFSEGRE